MRRSAVVTAICAAGLVQTVMVPAGAARAQEPAAGIVAPSGLVVQIHDVVVEQDGLVRLRFLAPALAEGADFARIEGDFPWLCTGQALPALAANGVEAQQIVISVMDRPVPFGTLDPDAIQFFEAFRIADGDCILEVF